MDDASLLLVRGLWPDVADPFARVVPDGCALVRALDDWAMLPSPVRVRRVELTPGPGCPGVEALLDEVAEDAERRGWTPVDEETSDEERVLEIEGVILRARAAEVVLAAGAVETLAVSFHQPWPDDAGAPVETSEAFQALVRKSLKLGGSPTRLVKDVTVAVADPGRFEAVRERVDLPIDPTLIARFGALGFAFDEVTEAWMQHSVSGDQRLRAVVREAYASVCVELVRVRG